MKRVLFILFSLLALSVSVNAQFISGGTKILLTQKSDDREMDDRSNSPSPEDLPQARSIISQPVYAYLYNKVVTVDFQAVFFAVTVNVVDEMTGETVYSELFTNPASFSIDLSGKDAGDYMIEIVSDEILLEGYFSL